jgi:putative transposase
VFKILGKNMPQSLSSILVHIIFSTKNRQLWLHKEISRELYPYAATILKNHACHPYQIGGMPDHIHIICSQSKTISTSKLIEEVKSSSSKWIKTKDTTFRNHHFYPLKSS